MPDTTPDTSATPPESVRLNGWKDIAAYLDRGVRTVQRWEKDFDLPVRRLGPGEGVFALKHEIDTWQSTPIADRARTVNPRSATDNATVSTADADGATPPNGLARGNGTSNGDAYPAGEGGRPNGIGDVIGAARHPLTPADVNGAAHIRETNRLRRVLAVLFTAVLALGAWSTWSTWRVLSDKPAPSPSASQLPVPPASVQIDLDTLRALDVSGQELWHYQFPSRLLASEYGRYAVHPESRIGIDDIDGDGRREVWIVVIPESPAELASRMLWVFGDSGHLRWKYQYSGQVRFGGTSYGPLFPTYRVFTTTDPGGSAVRALWVVSTDPEMFPSVLQRLDPVTGKALSTYWSNGYIDSVVLGVVAGQPALLVGANFNDRRWKCGSLAVLDPLKPEGAAPADTAEYRCESCGAEPTMFLVFPKPARLGHPDMAGPVYQVAQAADRDLTVRVNHADLTGGVRADAMYHLDDRLRPKSVALADNFELVYRMLVRDGAAPAGHPDRIDPAREFLPIYRWNAATRTFVPMPKSPDAR